MYTSYQDKAEDTIAMNGRKGRTRALKVLEPFLYIAPALFFFGVFTYLPFVRTLYSSFFLVNAKGVLKRFIGLENYISVLANGQYLKSVANTLLFVFTSIPLSVLIALILALIANRKTRTSSIYETLFALTMAMSMSVTAMIFQLMYNPSVGILNAALGVGIDWLNDPRYAMTALVIINVWINIGYNFIFLLAAIRGISPDLLESATLDGAGIVRKTASVIIPLISPILFFLVISDLAKNMMMSSLVLILTQGGPQDSTHTMISYMYQQAVNNQNYNDAYASAAVSFLITFCMTAASFIFEKKKVYYS